MRLNHNLAALNIFRQYQNTLSSQSKALAHISSGEKIISAEDGPNSLTKSERMRLQIRGAQMAQRNVQDGASMLQTADSALDSMNSILLRVRELTVQSGSASNSPSDKKEIKNEINEMIGAYDDIVKNTEFNGVNLFNKEEKRLIQVGGNVGETMEMSFKDLSSSKVGDSFYKLEDLKAMDINSDEFVDKALNIIDGASKDVIDTRSKYGALYNNLEDSFENLSETEQVTQGAESNLRDADIAEEMMEYARTSILVQSSNAMMAQTNRLPQDMLKILENVRNR